MHETILQIEGMTCMGCVKSVRNALERLPGVAVQEVEIGHATLRHDPEAITPDAVISAIEAAGFAVESVEMR